MSSTEPFDRGLLSPATAGADATVSDDAVLEALIDVERAYLAMLVEAGIAPAGSEIGDAPAAESLVTAGIGGGNPVIPLVHALRESGSEWTHRGATSQDILDTALMLVATRARAIVVGHLDTASLALADLADRHRDTVAAARTLTQHSTPTTWGLRAANWLTAVLDARDELAALALPAQLGGASGTLASFVAIAGEERAARLPAALADALGLAHPAAPWHVSRAPVTRLGDALVRVTDALGMIAGDVANAARTEVGEAAEPIGGGSSAMPHKQNPVLSVLIRSTALRAPALASTLHLASALAVDERPDGAWHAEWPTLRELLRIALGSSALAARLTTGLEIDAARAKANLGLTGNAILSERDSLGGSGAYLGLSDSIIDAAIARVRA